MPVYILSNWKWRKSGWALLSVWNALGEGVVDHANESGSYKWGLCERMEWEGDKWGLCNSGGEVLDPKQSDAPVIEDQKDPTDFASCATH